jgi:hypothetical protein
VWLVIGASDPSPAGIDRVAKGLAGKAPGGLVFQTRDCGDQRNVFGFALAVADSADSAKATLQSARATVKDAYIKRVASFLGHFWIFVFLPSSRRSPTCPMTRSIGRIPIACRVRSTSLTWDKRVPVPCVRGCRPAIRSLPERRAGPGNRRIPSDVCAPAGPDRCGFAERACEGTDIETRTLVPTSLAPKDEGRRRGPERNVDTMAFRSMTSWGMNVVSVRARSERSGTLNAFT